MQHTDSYTCCLSIHMWEIAIQDHPATFLDSSQWVASSQENGAKVLYGEEIDSGMKSRMSLLLMMM